MGRRASPRVLFGYFLHNAKSDNPYSLRRELRGSANLEPAHRSRSFTPQQLKPFKGASRFCEPRFGSPRQRLHKNSKMHKRQALFLGNFLVLRRFFPFSKKTAENPLTNPCPWCNIMPCRAKMPQIQSICGIFLYICITFAKIIKRKEMNHYEQRAGNVWKPRL